MTETCRLRAQLALNLPAVLAGAVCSGIASANLVRLPTVPVALAAGVAGAVFASGVPGPRWRLAWLGIAFGLIGVLWGGVRLDALAESQLVERLGRPAAATAVVTSPPRRSGFSVRSFATVTRFAGRPLHEPVLLTLPPERAPPQGAVLEIGRAWPVEPHGPRDGFDERRWLERRGIQVVLRAEDVAVVGRRGGIGGVADRLRAHVERTIGRGAQGERKALLTGVVLGASQAVDARLQDAFRDSGLLHLMAVSGQNVAIIAGGVLAIAWLLAIPSLWARAIVIPVVLGYALAVGWQPSVVRATVAGVLVSIAWIASRPRDRWYALALGALLLLAWMPASVLEPGFQLSFVAVAAIFVLVPRIGRALEGTPLPRAVAQGIALAAGCTVATAPIVLLQFGSVPLWAVPANVLAEGAMPPLLGLCLAAAAVEPVSGSAAAALVWLAGWCAAWLGVCARLFSELPYASVGRAPAAVLLVLVAAGIAGRRLLPRHRRRDGLVLAVSLAAAGLAAWLAFRSETRWTPPAGLRVTFLDVGQGDGTLLEVAEGAVLVDQGPPEARVAQQLRQQGVRSLSLLVLTHPQRDHIGGAADVVRSLRVGALLDPALPTTSRDHDEAVDAADARSVRMLVARAGDEYRVGGLHLRVLWPDGPGPPGEDPNRRAIVLLASYGRTDVLLTADAESDVTGRLPLRAVEVLKVAHHGSSDTALADQLRVLRPRVAVISVGRANDYGHPTAETLGALATVPGLQVFRTDLDGRVVLETDGTGLVVRSPARMH